MRLIPRIWTYRPKSSRDKHCQLNILFKKKTTLVIGYDVLPLKGPRFVFRNTLEVAMVRTGWNRIKWNYGAKNDGTTFDIEITILPICTIFFESN